MWWVLKAKLVQRYHWHSDSPSLTAFGVEVVGTVDRLPSITRSSLEVKDYNYSYRRKWRHTRMISVKALVIVFVFLSSLHPRAEADNGEDGSCVTWRIGFWFSSFPGECVSDFDHRVPWGISGHQALPDSRLYRDVMDAFDLNPWLLSSCPSAAYPVLSPKASNIVCPYWNLINDQGPTVILAVVNT